MTEWRDLPPEDFEIMAHTIAKYLGRKITMDMLGLSKSCVLCKNFNKDAETCGLNGKRPPANIIAFGCELYERF